MYKKLVSLPFWVAFSLLGVAVLWLLSFEAFYSALLFGVLCIIILPYHFSQHRHILSRFLGLFVLIITFVFTHHYAIGEVNTRVRQLTHLTETSFPLSKLSWRDKIGLYGLNIATGVMTLPFAPQLAMETLWLAMPGGDNKVRVFYSDRILNSAQIQSEVTAFKNAFQQQAMTVKKTVHWSPRMAMLSPQLPSKQLQLGADTSSNALPLGQLTLSAAQGDQGWVLNINIRTKVAYSEQRQTLFLAHNKVIIQERLWWLLQQEKWLHPYMADWRTQIPLTLTSKG